MALLDLFEHAVDIGGGKVHARGGRDDFEFGGDLALAFAGLPQGLANPLGDGHAAQPGGALNIAIFRVLNDYLQPFSHEMSLVDSWGRVKFRDG